MALMQLADAILQATDDNLIATLVTIDKTAAFDCVNFDNLISKLKLYNFGPKATKWVENYLIERVQYVEIGAKNSNTMSVPRGVPQGSILGPLFYNIYTNELPSTIVDINCQEPVHREQLSLFPANCRKCGSVPAFADDATVIIETKNRIESQIKIDKATTSI